MTIKSLKQSGVKPKNPMVMKSTWLMLPVKKPEVESDSKLGMKVIAVVMAKIKAKSIRKAKALFLKEASGS